MVHRRARRRQGAPLTADGAAFGRRGLRRLPGDTDIAAHESAVHPTARSFGTVAELYERARPDYPAEAADYLIAALGLAPGRVVADLGAGTGKLTRRLLESGARVIAVEPLAEMRAVLEREVPAAEPLAATAEHTTLAEASLDAVAAGQAFHWFRADEALPEIARVLRPGGALGLIWNVRDPDDRLQAQLGKLLDPYRRGTPSRGRRRWDSVVSAFPTFATVERRSFDWTAELSAEGFVERVATTSVVAVLDEEPRAALLAQVRGLVEGRPEPIAFSYRTDVSVYRRV